MKVLLFALFAVVLAVATADENESVNIISRAEWGARNPRRPNNKLATIPPKNVVISHTATNGCVEQKSCYYHLRNILDIHTKQNGWNDIAYNFLVAGDGNVYEGRGWESEGAHTKGYNDKSLGIAFVGDFRYKSPSASQVDAAVKLLQYAVQNGKVAQDYKLFGQNQVSITQSPGKKVAEIIKTWDHWTAQP